MTTTKTNMTVANEIARQIGAPAFFMLGTRMKTGADRELAFDIRCRGAKCNLCRVRLDADDTYSVRFFRVRATSVRDASETTGVYVGDLHRVIEEATGLCLTPPRIVREMFVRS